MDGYGKDELIKTRAVLVDVASRRETISYTDLATRVGLDWNHKKANDRRLIGELLGEVSHEEYRKGRPLITAVVVRQNQGTPGKGFLGLEGFPETEEFWRTELKRVHDFWEW